MIGVFSYTVILTYLGLISGVAGIYFCASGNPVVGALLLVIAGLFDLFDGTVARTKKNRTPMEKGFGIQIDSLTDLVCFGVFPSVLGYACGMRIQDGKWYTWFYLIPIVLLPLCGLIRLAYYNVTEEERQKTENGKRKYFEGMPITMSMMIFAALFSFSNFIGHTAFPIVYACIMIVVSLLYVLKIKIPKPGKYGQIVMFLLGAIIFTFIILNFATDMCPNGNLLSFWGI